MLNKADSARIFSLLEKLGCNVTQAEVYVQSLQIGLASVQQIADALMQNRFTIHSAVQQLMKKGLLYETKKGKRRMIGAEDPDVLYHLIELKQSELQSLKTSLDYGANLLRSLQPIHPHRPTVRFYDGTDGLKKMMEETLNSRNDILVFSNVDLLAKLCGADYLENYYKRRAARGIHTQLIFPMGADFAERVKTKREKYNIDYRFLPKSYKWQSGIFAWNNAISLLSYTEQQVTCTIIENDDIADFYRNVDFKLNWEKALVPLSD